MKKERGGFTLIEMLVVIGIIGILASLILVGLGGARRAGADAKKIANLNQIRNSLELYYLKSGSYPADPAGNLISGIANLDKGKLTIDGTYFYKKDGAGYLIGTTLAEGSSEGYNVGTIGANDCASQTFYCLASE
jgi:prepilin-type N-terminal cleavage/methylation domain-containing protein